MDKDNKSFCILPFIEAYQKDTRYKLCCMSDFFDYTKGTDENSIMDFMNSPEVIDIRKKMLAGEQVDICKICYNDERITGSSKRLSGNAQLDYPDIIDYVKNNNGKIPHIKALDFRPDKLCNLKCKMCNSGNSSEINKEDIYISENFGIEHFEMLDKKVPQEYIPKDNSNVLKDIYEMVPYLDRLAFAGGEPTILPDIKSVMQYCIDTNMAKDIDLRTPLNLTNLNQKFMDMLVAFKSTTIHCSIDGAGDVNSYIRYPSNWNKTVENLNKLLNMDVTVMIVITVQNLNVLSMDKFVEFIISLDKDVRIYSNFLHSPNYLECTVLPTELKKEALVNIDKALNMVESSSLGRKTKKDNISELIKIKDYVTNSLDDEVNPVLEKKFKYFINFQDKIRNQDINDVVPQIGKWVK